jgi:hypothetical protein
VPLTYRDRGESKSGTRWTVRAGSVEIGSINKSWQSLMSAKSGETWDWHLNAHKGPPGYRSSGLSNSLAEAKAELEKNWSLWLDAVLISRTPEV